MELSVKYLQEMGSFTGAPVEKEITWNQDGEEKTATTYVRKLSYKTAVSDFKNYQNGDIVAGRIASCICDKDGKAVFTVEDITGESNVDRGPFNHNLTISLLDAIAEVNKYMEK